MGKFTIFVEEDYEAASKRAAEIIAETIKENNNKALGLATGSTPIGTYENLVKQYEAGELDFSNVKTANLDEYKGLSEENDQSYRYFMNDHLFNHVNIDKKNTYVPNGTLENADEACEEYEKVIESLGGISLQLLGLGHNGHIGFNEPADEFPAKTHAVKLQESTIKANARFFEDASKVPTIAYTMGIGTIMSADKILLLVTGKDKAEILHKVLNGPVTPNVPASILQFHKNVTVVCDKAAYL